MGLSKCNTVTNEAGQELLEHGNVLFPMACYCDSIHTEPVPWHWHEELEAAVVVEGTAILAVGMEKYKIGQGCGFFVNTGNLHAVWSVGTSACILHSMCFHPKLVGGNPDSIFWAKYLRPLLEDKISGCICLDSEIQWQQEAIHIVEAAWGYHVEEPEGFEIEVRYALSKLILLLNSHRSPVHANQSDKSLREAGRLKDMLRFIQQNYREEIRLREIADSASISESECLRCFRAAIGTTPIQYVKQYRLQKAAELLKTQGFNVSETAEQCGFTDMSYFAKEFRKAYGCTPSKYRS